MPFTIGGDWIPNEQPEKQGQAPKVGKPVKVRKEKRGKAIVTRVLNLVRPKDQLLALAAELKQLCGCGGTVKDDVIEIQGDQVDRVRDHLRRKGINPQ